MRIAPPSHEELALGFVISEFALAGESRAKPWWRSIASVALPGLAGFAVTLVQQEPPRESTMAAVPVEQAPRLQTQINPDPKG